MGTVRVSVLQERCCKLWSKAARFNMSSDAARLRYERINEERSYRMLHFTVLPQSECPSRMLEAMMYSAPSSLTSSNHWTMDFQSVLRLYLEDSMRRENFLEVTRSSNKFMLIWIRVGLSLPASPWIDTIFRHSHNTATSTTV